MDSVYLQQVMNMIEMKVDRLLELAGDKWLDHADKDGFYQVRRPDWWTSGFWPGILWIMYDLTGKESYKQAAWYLLRS
jgi:unsaturated chondroitin disaccharide hydrolase